MKRAIVLLWAVTLALAFAVGGVAQSGHRVWTQNIVITVREAIEVVWRLPGGECIGDTCELVLAPGDVATGRATISNVSAAERLVALSYHPSDEAFGAIEASWLGVAYEVPGKSNVTTDFTITATAEAGPVTYTLTAIRVIP